MRRLLSWLCCWDSLWAFCGTLWTCRSTRVLLGRPVRGLQAQGPLSYRTGYLWLHSVTSLSGLPGISCGTASQDVQSGQPTSSSSHQPGHPVDWSPPGPSAHGTFQARALEWVAVSSSRLLLDPGIRLASPSLLYWQVGSLPPAPSHNGGEIGQNQMTKKCQQKRYKQRSGGNKASGAEQRRMYN